MAIHPLLKFSAALALVLLQTSKVRADTLSWPDQVITAVQKSLAPQDVVYRRLATKTRAVEAAERGGSPDLTAQARIQEILETLDQRIRGYDLNAASSSQQEKDDRENLVLASARLKSYLDASTGGTSRGGLSSYLRDLYQRQSDAANQSGKLNPTSDIDLMYIPTILASSGKTGESPTVAEGAL